MKAYEKNYIVEYSSVYSHLIKPDKRLTLDEYADEIEKNYSFFNERTKQVCMWLRGTYGTITRNRYGQTFIKYEKHKD